MVKLLNQVNVPTLVAIFAMNGWNIGATNSAKEHIDKVQKGLSEIHDLHAALYDFEKRQKQALENQEQLLRNQTEILEAIRENQRKLIERQNRLFPRQPEGP